MRRHARPRPAGGSAAAPAPRSAGRRAAREPPPPRNPSHSAAGAHGGPRPARVGGPHVQGPACRAAAADLAAAAAAATPPPSPDPASARSDVRPGAVRHVPAGRTPAARRGRTAPDAPHPRGAAPPRPPVRTDDPTPQTARPYSTTGRASGRSPAPGRRHPDDPNGPPPTSATAGLAAGGAARAHARRPARARAVPGRPEAVPHPELSVDQADQLAAIAAGIQSLSHGASIEFGDGSGGVRPR